VYTVALVQNQSEMAHYGYADARIILDELGYRTLLYTAANVAQLRDAVLETRLDAIVLASNALNDKTIRAELVDSHFTKVLGEYLRAGHGLLSLHQLGVAQSTDDKRL
jgi:hypothetical protein